MSGYIGEGLLGRNSYATDQTSNFYDDYCERYDLQCMISEGGAAYHVDVTGGSSLEEVQTGYIQDVYANDTFLAAFPRIKLIMQFEQEKCVRVVCVCVWGSVLGGKAHSDINASAGLKWQPVEQVRLYFLSCCLGRLCSDDSGLCSVRRQ